MTAQAATATQATKGNVFVRQGAGDVLREFDRIYNSIARRAVELFEGNGR